MYQSGKVHQVASGEGPSSNNMYKDIGMSWEQVKRTTQNRLHWRKTVEGLCSGRSEED